MISMAYTMPEPVPARFAGRERAVPVTADEGLHSLARPGRLLVDARSADRYRGENETLNPVDGRNG